MALPDNPITRVETYLSNIAGENTTLPDHPITRIEQYLDHIAKNFDDMPTEGSSNPVSSGGVYASEQAIRDSLTHKRYGVAGIGKEPAALTRLWDATGLTAQVGTDGDNSGVINDFDYAAPFMRRKCVGEWSLVDGRPKFTVNAYLGDDDYAEDGTMGDYVAVECPRCYYYLDNDTGVLGVSDYQHEGWRPFDIFCRNHDPNDTVEKAYIPAYALALKDGKAVSLPGLDNEQGSYYSLTMAARTYEGEVGAFATLEPAALNFYEWALFTVEFATQDCQSIMQGCCNLRHNADDRVTFADATHILTSSYQAGRVDGQYLAIIATSTDINNTAYQATHKALSATRCDENGVASNSGTHQLIELQDLGKGYLEYDATGATEYRIAARPYRTGDCNGVSTASGSPASNVDGCRPCRYRWRENPYGNQNRTASDLFNSREGTGDDDYWLKWYLLLDPTQYAPSSSSKPDINDLGTDKFAVLDIETAHEDYANGYIKSKQFSRLYPDIWIPGKTKGGSASTYTADYASLVNSHRARAVRFGGFWYIGANDGFSYASANFAPSYAPAPYGSGLCFPQ